MSDTPRTDEAQCKFGGWDSDAPLTAIYADCLEWAKQLERELSEAVDALVVEKSRSTDLALELEKAKATPSASADTRPGRIPELESTRINAGYWIASARKAESPAEALLFVEQAVNAWKNAAYAMADRWYGSAVPATPPEAARTYSCEICKAMCIEQQSEPEQSKCQP